ncbi:MAG: DNA-directed RNA polymerase subunit beta' [Planctomycetota bacterium]
MEARDNSVNDYGSVTIRLASPADIRNWSYGEVKKPETINYRTYRSEKDGLFCERIFGPEKDWECSCGKYKGIKHKGIVCDRCGVKVTHSRERRTRMGHINLAAPVAHIWFFKAMPSRLGTMLAMKTSDLEKVIYFQDYVVVETGNPEETGLLPQQLLNEEEYREAKGRFGDKFEALMGADAVKKLLLKLDLNKASEELRQELAETRSKQRAKDIVKRLKTIEALRDSDNRPEWMILDVIPVIPPDLRPLVLLESGNFASSDLNDLYRRLINRNNRLKKFLDLNAPEVIIRNEKRMLQQSVDALFDNARCRRSVLGSNNRPLKSLTDMIKGKQGRFRENLLGKRVDYSARSVIVVGPDLKIHQCGLPKKIALELYQPFIIRRLKELGHADTIRSAKKMLERKDDEVWDILEEVIDQHPVLLNRAPTLHRMGIQAFEPVLIEGNAIRLHPLVCTGFNADFDGDQMAVHLPLSFEAQVEARTLMLSPNNIFSPASGQPVISPTQDVVLGGFYLTSDHPHAVSVARAFGSMMAVITAFSNGKVRTHTKVKVRFRGKKDVLNREGLVELEDGEIATTVGRVLFNDILHPDMIFYNVEMTKKMLSRVIVDCNKRLGRKWTLQLLDDLKEIGFKSATRAGLSFAKNDMRMPDRKKQIVETTEKQVLKIESNYASGVITDGERYNQVIDAWTHAREFIGEAMMAELKDDFGEDGFTVNPIYMMAESGARGSVEQIRQLAGMRGLMAKPNGKIIESPIKANFREGLRVLEYFSSTHGARKGLADTALKTADSGYLTRKLTDVTQNVVVRELNCGTTRGISKSAVFKGEHVEVSLADNVRGRGSADTIKDVISGAIIVKAGEIIGEKEAARIEELGYERVRVRSPLTCETARGVCAACYGQDLSRNRRVEIGSAVGVIGAQSIGEPGTQLTMRTFHIGGTASRSVAETHITCRAEGTVEFRNIRTVETPNGLTVLNRNGEIALIDEKDRELERYTVPLGSEIEVVAGSTVKGKTVLCRWDPHNIPIIAERPGKVRFEDIVEGETMKREKDPGSKVRRMVIMEHKGDLHPQIIIEDDDGNPIGLYPIPEKAHLEVKDGKKIKAGSLLAKTPREITGTQDITGGLPRVTELFEARVPKDPSVIAEIDGTVELGDKKRGKRVIIVKGEGGMERAHLVPHSKHLRVHRGDFVRSGEALIDGSPIPHDILRISGMDALHEYLLREIQSVYRSQGVRIDDKHIEIVVAQMLRKVRVENPGDTEFLTGYVVDKHVFKEANDKVKRAKGKPATAQPLLLGITKAALQSESFISAASFQETTKVLTEAALAGKSDELRGLKENVILGHLIPAGTGFTDYHATLIKHQWEDEEVEEKKKTPEKAAEEAV